MCIFLTEWLIKVLVKEGNYFRGTLPPVQCTGLESCSFVSTLLLSFSANEFISHITGKNGNGRPLGHVDTGLKTHYLDIAGSCPF